MKVTVRYLAQLRDAAGRASEQVETGPEATAAQLLRRLAEAHGGRLGRLLLDAAGGAQPALLIFHGDDQVGPEQALALSDGDVLTLLSPMAGG
jgi:molybdopterin converting factor small subunit